MQANDLTSALQWRYATKQFDATKRIPDATWAALESSLVLTPSSFGLQPWKFIVITDPALKAQLKPVSWNQSQVTDCSHYVVFSARTAMDEAYIDRNLSRQSELRDIPVETFAKYREMMIRDLIQGGPRSAIIPEWATRQCYIALGQFMTACAVLGVDACPMEGIDPAKYDAILGLPALGYRTAVACAAGYRSATDKYAAMAKVRLPADDIIIRR